MGSQNLTPDQRSMPKTVQRDAYKAIPESCHRVRSILSECADTIMADLEIPPEDYPTIDVSLSHAFQRIRDEVAHPFRTMQMRLLKQLEEPNGSIEAVPSRHDREDEEGV